MDTTDSGPGDDTSNQSPIERSLSVMVVSIMIITSILLAFRTPTFDFDEALYRRVAEEMKASHRYFAMTWDGRPFLEKPPTYVWTIVASSRLIDGRSKTVSTIAARLPSLIFSGLTLLLLAFSWKIFQSDFKDGHRGILSSPLLPVIAFGAALFPMVQVTSVLLDPMLTFFSTIVLLVFDAALHRRADGPLILSRRQQILAALAITAAVSVKGLIGFVAPAIALVVHDLLTSLVDRRRSSFLNTFRLRAIGTVAGSAPVFAIAIVLSAIVFVVFYREAGAPFIHEFLVRQHFDRGARAFQGHKGPFWYYIALLIAGGPVTAFLLLGLGAKRGIGDGFASWGFPLSWSLALITFVSCLATKLPNYTWPVWPAISLSLCIVFFRMSRLTSKRRPVVLGSISSIAAWMGIAASAAFAFLSIALAARFHTFVRMMAHSLKAISILRLLDPLPPTVRAGLALLSVAFAVQAVIQWKYKRAVFDWKRAWHLVAAAAAVNCLVLVLVSEMVLPFADRAIRAPLVRTARLASIAGSDSLTTIGLFSPTISSNYSGRHLIQIGVRPTIGSLANRESVIVPVWQTASCPASEVIQSDGYLVLCAHLGLLNANERSSTNQRRPLVGAKRL